MTETDLTIAKSPMTEEGTAELISRARAGDERALEELIARVEGRVYGLARGILKDRGWAEDVVQETVLRMARKLGAFCGTLTDFEVWTLKIARNAALDRMRKRVEGPEPGAGNFACPEHGAPAQAEESWPLDELIAREDLGAIGRAMDELPGPWREVLVLRFQAGLEPAEIAKIIEVTPENARVRLWRALEELRRRLAHGESPGSLG